MSWQSVFQENPTLRWYDVVADGTMVFGTTDRKEAFKWASDYRKRPHHKRPHVVVVGKPFHYEENPVYASRTHLRPMTKVEAKRIFESYRLPHVIERYGSRDKSAVAQAWVEWIDMLYDDGRITKRQADSWDNPYYK